MFSYILRIFLIGSLAACLWAGRPGDFQIIGPGGGGAMFNPTVSPHDENTVLVSCDMTGAYITHDGGRSWRMFNLRGTVRFFAFDPVNPKTLYAYVTGLWRSTDDGETWNLVYPKPSAVRGIRMNSDHADETIVADPDPLGRIATFAIDPADSKILYAAAGRDKSTALYVSRDFGASWQQESTLPEAPLRMWIDPHSPPQARSLYLVGPHKVVIKNSTGLHDFPAPGTARITDATAGFNSQAAPVIYVISNEQAFVSSDEGKSWQQSRLPGESASVRAVATSLRHPEIAYLSYHHLNLHGKRWFGVAKTEDAGSTWKLVWQESETAAPNIHDAWITARLGPAWAENPLMLGVADQNPNLCYGTDFGRTMQTVDGGANWKAVYSREVSSGMWTTTGLDVTTNYGIHFDPFDTNRQFITYTDIGLFRSEDGGKSWVSSTHGVPRKWLNTTYWVVFDPDVKGRMWSANSYTHDLPRPKMWRHNSVQNFMGGICRSDDGGRSWVKSNAGMPETAVTHVLLDPTSSKDHRVLYAAAFGRGVYKSVDDGRTWAQKNNGITQAEPFAWRLTRGPDGTLYLVLARRSEDGSIGNAGDGALYKSTDSAESWQPVPLPSGVNGPNGLAVDPKSPQRLYLAAWTRATASLHGEGGGIYISDNGGHTWHEVLDRDQHVYDITIDTRTPNVMYAAGFESSAWRSQDRGDHWTRIPGFNFKWGHRVILDPKDPGKIYVTTFGGSVWHGSVNGKPAIVDIATPELQPGK
ncbi:MAG TPA: hypothetical protein VLI55_04970 [Bryobacteraceae bacterium]|nr:hypothetical protein [Bryobacteraceae bacterium]